MQAKWLAPCPPFSIFSIKVARYVSSCPGTEAHIRCQKKEPKQKTASEAVASWVIVDVAWRISVLRHVTLMEVLQNKLPDENKSIKSVELTEGATMSFAVVVPPTAPAKRWRSEMELPKSRAGNEHICNRSTSAQHLFLARGLFAG